MHPPSWKNPQSASRYNPVVIGAAATGLSARAVLIEKHFMGDDGLNIGHVPSMTLIQADP